MAENPIILSDEDTDDPVTPMLPLSKRLRATRAELGLDPPPTIFLIDDDPTPLKPTSNHSSTPSFVPETPMSDVAAVKCTVDVSSPGIRVTDYGRTVVSGDGGAVHLEKELFDSAGCSGGAVHLEKQRFDSAGCSGGGNWRENETVEIGDDDDENEVEWRSRFSAPVDSLGDGGAICLETHRFSSAGCSGSGNRPENETLEIRDDDDDDNEVDWRSKFSAPDDSLGGPNLSQMSGTNSLSFEDDQPYDNYQKENLSWEQMCGIAKQKTITNSNSEENNSQTEKAIGKKRMTKEERTRVMEEKKRKKEEEKLQKAALKAQEAEQKKIDRELLKWSNGKLAPKSIVAQLDNKVVEQGGIGGYLLSRFAEKGLTYRIASHPIERSILWSMTVPENLAQLSVQAPDVQYVLFIYEAEEFCNLVTSGSLISHISKVRSKYPSYTICYLTNKLMAYIKRREQEQYKNPGSSANAWKPPPIDEMLAKLTTHYDKVYYRHCRDESEVAEHVVGLTSSLATCQCRKELTRLSVNANGSTIPKDFIDKDLIKKSPWLKALVVIPKVQPRFAVAIWKKYPTMKSLLRVYMDPNKSVHEKEFMLANLPVEKVLGGESRIGEICSKRVYRILMAESGSIITEDVENGADFFQRRAP